MDAEALSALAENDRRMQVWMLVARRTDSVLYASTATFVEVTDGSLRDARVRRAVKALRLREVTEAIGFRAGALRAGAVASRSKPRDLTVDSIVAATALELPPPVVVLTSDVGGLRLLLSDSAIRVESIG
ncbi:MAG: hypothetical protein QM650_00820 [Microlunatus sp.]